MEKQTALIRRLLILEGLQRHFLGEIASIKQKMREDGLRIIDRQDSPMDIWIQYQNENEFGEAIFMRRMLDAETTGLVKRTGMVTRQK